MLNVQEGFETLERRAVSAIEISEDVMETIRFSARESYESMPLAPHERRAIYQLLGIILEGKTPDGREYLPSTLGAVGADLRRCVDLARLYSDQLHEIAYRIVRPAYQAGFQHATHDPRPC